MEKSSATPNASPSSTAMQPHEIIATVCEAIVDHLDNRAAAPSWFEPDYGLCTQLNNYCRLHNLSYYPVLDELEALFEPYGSYNYPFNATGAQAYIHERTKGAIWRNPRRLNFIRQQKVKK